MKDPEVGHTRRPFLGQRLTKQVPSVIHPASLTEHPPKTFLWMAMTGKWRTNGSVARTELHPDERWDTRTCQSNRMRCIQEYLASTLIHNWASPEIDNKSVRIKFGHDHLNWRMNLLLGLHYTPLKPRAPIPPARVSKLPNLFVVHGWTTRKS